MSQQSKTLWIAGDSYGTFDRNDGSHWIKQFAKHKGCDRIFNLCRGGFDNKAICYVAREIIENHKWPGRCDHTEHFDLGQDIIVVFSTDPARFSMLSTVEKDFQHDLSIANLNWWVGGLVHKDHNGETVGEQEPMPWQDHMPEQSNLYSQSINTVIDGIMETHTFEDADLITDLASRLSWQWEEQTKDQMLHGLYHLHQTYSQGSEMYLTGNMEIKRPGVNYIPPLGAAIWEGWIAAPEDELEHARTALVNHHTPAEHFHFWRILKEKLYK